MDGEERTYVCDDVRYEYSEKSQMLFIISNSGYSYEKGIKKRRQAYIIHKEEQESGEDLI